MKIVARFVISVAQWKNDQSLDDRYGDELNLRISCRASTQKNCTTNQTIQKHSP